MACLFTVLSTPPLLGLSCVKLGCGLCVRFLSDDGAMCLIIMNVLYPSSKTCLYRLPCCFMPGTVRLLCSYIWLVDAVQSPEKMTQGRITMGHIVTKRSLTVSEEHGAFLLMTPFPSCGWKSCLSFLWGIIL